ncbi:MAG: hypothetical protein KF740_01170 [Ramlibacter sp.]|nr:hypothetical protein [Ramlibacter sp.]
MEPFLLLMILVATAAWWHKAQDQGRRIALLARQLGHYQIEKHMETLTQGYLRALGEADAQRREQVWALLQSTEQALDAEFSRFAADFARLDGELTRVSRLPLYLPLLTRLLPQATFDMRQALALHAAGIHRAASGAGPASYRDRAFMLSAELFLMQHSCHWFCKSKLVASARLLARHQTSYDQVLAAVSSQTQAAYLALVAR